MTLLHSLLLGTLQGLTEFLPISSSGHLAIVEMWFQLPISARDLQGFDIVLHGGSLIALFMCYVGMWKKMALSFIRKDPQARRLFGLLIVASIPAVIAGFFLKDYLETQFRSELSLAVQFLITGLILLFIENYRYHRTIEDLDAEDALKIGFAQALALVPALSRSGLTIAAGRFLGLTRQDAVDFSFLMALPVIAGATLLNGIAVARGTVVLPPADVTGAGFAASLVASIAAIGFLKKYAGRINFIWFGAYLILLSIIVGYGAVMSA